MITKDYKMITSKNGYFELDGVDGISATCGNIYNDGRVSYCEIYVTDNSIEKEEWMKEMTNGLTGEKWQYGSKVCDADAISFLVENGYDNSEAVEFLEIARNMGK